MEGVSVVETGDVHQILPRSEGMAATKVRAEPGLTARLECPLMATSRHPRAVSQCLLCPQLRTFQKTLGPEHPNVAQSLNNLAELYRAQGRYGEAELGR